MKFTAAGSPNNNMNQTNNREYVSISPKFASATYSEGFGKQYNSPKTGGPAKGFIIPKTNNENLVSTFTKQQKNNSFLGQNKDKFTRGPILLVGSEVQTPKTLVNSTINNQTLGIKDDKKATPQKAKNELRTVSSSTPKNSNSYRPSDLSKGREESSYSGNYKWKKLEISTDYNNVRTSYANKAQTTKHTETEEDLTRETTTKSSGISQSVNKSTQNKGANSATYNSYSSANDKPRTTRPLSSSDANLRSNSAQKEAKNGGYQNRNASSTRDAPTPKVNNFLASDSKSGIKNKATSSATKLGQTLSAGFDDNMTQSTGFMKKSTNKTQADLRSSWHSTANDTLKSKNRPSSAKKPARDSREETVEKISPKDEKTSTQRVSLQMFVTKVNKGDAFSSIKKYGDRSNSTRKNQQKPYLTIEDKASKPVKAVDLELKGSKTTPNLESKAFAVSLGKHNPQTPVSKGKSATTSKYGSSSSLKEQNKSTQEVAKTQGREPFIYYMSGLEKAHRWDGEVDYFVQIYREHFLQTYQALSFCKVLKPFDPAVLAQKRVNLTRRDTHHGKKTLIFDMDETLIHCNESPDLPCDVILPITFPNGEIVEAGVNVRPYALEILKELSQHYEIVVFTASHACYANVVLDYLDPQEQYIHHRLFRDSCVVTEEGVHIKDLRVIGNRDMKDMILVDNAAYSFGFQIENGIPIIPFYDNKSDQELRHLIPYLKFLNSVEDLREINKQTFKLHMFANYDAPEAVLERLILQN